MATSAWRFFEIAKLRILDGTINLGTSAFKMHLYKSGSNITDLTHSTRASLTNQLTGIPNYTQSGIALANPTLSQSAGTITWNISDFVLTASGEAWLNVRHALIQHSDIPVCYSELSTAGFDVSDTNSLTITINASGVMELSGGTT